MANPYNPYLQAYYLRPEIQNSTGKFVSEAAAAVASETTIPKCYLCPFTGEIMSDPVEADDSKIYDRINIEKYFNKYPEATSVKSPLNPTVVMHKGLIPIGALKELIVEYNFAHK